MRHAVRRILMGGLCGIRISRRPSPCNQQDGAQHNCNRESTNQKSVHRHLSCHRGRYPIIRMPIPIAISCLHPQSTDSIPRGVSTDRQTDGYIGHPALTISSIHQRGQPACSLPARLSLTHVSHNASFLASSNHPSIKNLPAIYPSGIHQILIRCFTIRFSQCFHLPMLRHLA